MSELVRKTARANGVRSIAAEQNDVIASLLYYLRDDAWPIFSSRTGAAPLNQFDLDRPLSSVAAKPILYLSNSSSPPKGLAKSYSTVETLPPIDAATGPHSVRRLFAFKLSSARAMALSCGEEH